MWWYRKNRIFSFMAGNTTYIHDVHRTQICGGKHMPTSESHPFIVCCLLLSVSCESSGKIEICFARLTCFVLCRLW